MGVTELRFRWGMVTAELRWRRQSRMPSAGDVHRAVSSGRERRDDR